MRYLLIPISMFLWYLTAYYGLYISFIGMMYIFSLSWLWLLIGYPFIIGIVFGISNGIPSILRLLTLNFFGINWVNCVLHSVAGAIGVIQISRFYIKNPPELVFGDEAVFFLAGMWRVDPFKTIFLALPFIGLVLSLIWSSTIAPLYIKCSIRNNNP